MKATPRSSTPSKLSDSLQHRLNSYALVATAAGVGLLSISQLAEAKVVYTPSKKRLPVNAPFTLDLNHDGVPDFRLRLGKNSTNYGWFDSLKATGARGNAIWENTTTFYQCAAALPAATKVGPESPFRQGNLMMFLDGDNGYSGFSFGPWRYVQTYAYLGLKFKINGRVHYGWARIGQIIDNYPVAKLSGYAHETIPNKPIITGKTNRPDVITLPMDTGTLGHLAHGRK